MFKRLLLVAFLMQLLLSYAANAATASTSISNFTLSVTADPVFIDLASVHIVTMAGNGTNFDINSQDGVGPDYSFDLSSTFSVADLYATSDARFDALDPDSGLATAVTSLSSYVYSYASVATEYNYVANSIFTITVDANVRGNGHVGDNFESFAFIYLYNGVDSYADPLNGYSYINGNYDLNQKLTLTYQAAFSGVIYFGAQTGSMIYYTNPSAVPEPEAYAMLLAGLGLLGGVARSKRS